MRPVFGLRHVFWFLVQALEEEASADFGEDGALWSLKDKCVTHTTGNYEYRVCLFKDAHQNEKKSKVREKTPLPCKPFCILAF